MQMRHLQPRAIIPTCAVSGATGARSEPCGLNIKKPGRWLLHTAQHRPLIALLIFVYPSAITL